MDTIEKINIWLIWYENNMSKATITQLQDFQCKLSILSVRLAELVAKSKGDAVRAYFDRKYTFSINKMGFINGKEGINKSETMAEASIKDKRDTEVQAIEYSELLRLQLRQVNKVLSAAQQRISFKKAEWEKNNYIPQT